jgi:hypothetical protein
MEKKICENYDELYELIYKDLCALKTKFSIYQKMKANGYEGFDTASRSKKMLYFYIQKAGELAKYEIEKNRDKEREAMYTKLKAMADECWANKKYKVALDIMNSISRLSGIEEAQKFDIKNNVNLAIDFSNLTGNEDKDKGVKSVDDVSDDDYEVEENDEVEENEEE